MQKISFGRKDYVKASEIAKRFKYTQDYVGQLCRNKKVDARLVGRTWYVEPESVVAYRKTKHSTQKSAATKVALNTQTKRHPNPKPVAAVVRSKTLKSTQQLASTSSAPVTPVSYSADDEVSIPVLDKNQEAKVLDLKTTEDTPTPESSELTMPKKPTHTIKVKKSGSQKSKFKTEKLPEISLSGKLEVQETTNETEAKEQATIKSQASHSTPATTSSTIKSSAPTKREHVSFAQPSPQPNRQAKLAKDTFAPNQVQASFKAQSRSSFLYSDQFLFASLALGVCSALAILSLASLGQISPTNNNSWSLFFDLAQLKNLVF